jgi:hypothetical protein
MPDMPWNVLVQRLAGVLLEVGAGQLHLLRIPRRRSPTAMEMLPPAPPGSSNWLIW